MTASSIDCVSPTSRFPPPPRTYRELLNEATTRLLAAGIANARYEAGWLVNAALRVRPVDLYLRGAQPLDPDQAERAILFVQRRARREPLQYILGSQEFCGLEFLVTPAVLIPRPETELLVGAVLAHISTTGSPRCADVGTGSGCIAVALAKERADATIYALDLSSGALAVARQNAERHGVTSRLVFLEGDLLSRLEGVVGEGGLSAVVANLPYIADAELAVLQREVQHEPRMALAGGGDGLCLYRRLIPAAARLLKPTGLLALEVGAGQAPTAVRLAETTGNYYNTRTLMDDAGIERVVLCLRR